MDLQLRHLRNLCAIAEAGSLNRAAAALGLPQPALSRQVRRLEHLFGAELFTRDPGGVQLTTLGAGVVAQAESIVQLHGQISARFTDFREQRRQFLRVGWDGSPLSEYLLNGLWELRPEGRLQIVALNTSCDLDARLRAGEVDLALFSLDNDQRVPEFPGVAVETIAVTEAMLALSEQHPLASRPAITMAELSQETWISCSGPDGCADALRRLCHPFGYTPEIAYDIPVTGPRGEVIRRGDCVALAQPLRATGPGVVQRHLADLRLESRHLLVYRPGPHLTPLIPPLVHRMRTAHALALRSNYG